MKKNDEGFSLVELIIVIAIMAVLIGMLAPQYLRFVDRSKVSGDVQNAQNLATAINTTIAENPGGTVSINVNETLGGTSIAGIKGVDELPVCLHDPNFKWTIACNDTDGVTSIILGDKEIYPGSEYYDEYYH